MNHYEFLDLGGKFELIEVLRLKDYSAAGKWLH